MKEEIKPKSFYFDSEEDLKLFEDLEKLLYEVNKNKKDKRIDFGSFNLVIELNKEENKLTQKNFLRTTIKSILENRTVTKDFIELEEPYYFNMDLRTLTEGKPIKAYTRQPLADRINTYAIYLVPNNLDAFDSNLASYHYGNKASLHRGIYIFYDLKKEPVPIPLIFDFDSEAKEITIVYVKLENLIDYAEKEEDYYVIDNLLESVKSSKEIKLEDNYKVIMNVGRLNRVGLTYELGKAEGLDNIKEMVSNSINVKASEINNPVEAIVEENKRKDKQIEEYKAIGRKGKRIMEKLNEIDNKEHTKEEILEHFSKGKE